MSNAESNKRVVPRTHPLTDALERCELKARAIANQQRMLLANSDEKPRLAVQEDGATYPSVSGETP